MFCQVLQKLYRMQLLSIKISLKPEDPKHTEAKHKVWSYQYRKRRKVRAEDVRMQIEKIVERSKLYCYTIDYTDMPCRHVSSLVLPL